MTRRLPRAPHHARIVSIVVLLWPWLASGQSGQAPYVVFIDKRGTVVLVYHCVRITLLIL